MVFIVNGLTSAKDSNCGGGCEVVAFDCGVTTGFFGSFKAGFKFSWSNGFGEVSRPFPAKVERDNSGTRVV